MNPYGIVCAIICIISCGCSASNHTDTGTMNGALVGAGVGAAIGEHNDQPLAGALIGATTGAIAGNMIGESMDRREAAYEAKFRKDQEIMRQHTTDQSKNAVTLEQLLKMSQANVSDDVIVSQIEGRGAAQSLSTEDIIYLTRQQVSSDVIKSYQTSTVVNSGRSQNSTKLMRTQDGPVVVERHYHRGVPHRYYQPTPVIPPRSGFFIGVGN